MIDRYVDKVCKDIQSSNYCFDTVYFGGGTPSFIGAENIAKILSFVKHKRDCEITVECNPTDTGTKDVEFDFSLLHRYGVNRISMGLQSSDEVERRLLGRKSGCDEILRAMDRATKSGINNISLDIMLGIPDQTEETLEKSLDFCIDAGAKHISTYMLKIEEGTFFFKNQDKYNFHDDDKAADYYLFTADKLKKAGMRHYEISNFSYDGYESKHNLRYWKGSDYLGLGPSAHSFIDGKRFYFSRNIEDYINNANAIDDGEGGNEEEFVMLSLRLDEGIIFNEFSKKFNKSISEEFLNKCKEFEKMKLGTLTENSFSLTTDGYLVSNSIICELCDNLQQ